VVTFSSGGCSAADEGGFDGEKGALAGGEALGKSEAELRRRRNKRGLVGGLGIVRVVTLRRGRKRKKEEQREQRKRENKQTTKTTNESNKTTKQNNQPKHPSKTKQTTQPNQKQINKNKTTTTTFLVVYLGVLHQHGVAHAECGEELLQQRRARSRREVPFNLAIAKTEGSIGSRGKRKHVLTKRETQMKQTQQQNDTNQNNLRSDEISDNKHIFN
jgi:hypothetical protein